MSQKHVPDVVGPVLFYRACSETELRLDLLIAVRKDLPAPAVTIRGGKIGLPQTLYEAHGVRVLRWALSFDRGDSACYSVAGRSYAVAANLHGNLRIGYVSCNGLERGDGARDLAERNRMWERLAKEIEAPQGLHLLLHGGDQLYADEVLGAHPRMAEWQGSLSRIAATLPFDDDVAEAIEHYLLHRYLSLYAQPQIAAVLARVPSLMMWDDHDIIDGWGSLRPRRLDSPIGRGIFANARRLFCVFQMGARADALPASCLDTKGRSLGWQVRVPGASLVAPDLRSERRPDRVMGEPGWAAYSKGLERTAGDEHLFVLSSVPAMGPRLSWVESAMKLLPWMQKYEDDLNDQWQSRAHRAEWQRFLRTLIEHAAHGGCVTVLSGEIHLATRAEMRGPSGAFVHQLVASGVAHPQPPAAFGHSLGLLARLGEQPLADCHMNLHPLPGRKAVYTRQRNYLLLTRTAGRWAAEWELEHDGRTASLDLRANETT